MMRIGYLIALLLISPCAMAQPVTAPPVSPAWYAGAMAFIPTDYVAGMAFNTDDTDSEAPKGYVAVYPAGADDPKTPASAFDPGMMLVAKLRHLDGKLVAISGELLPRDVTLRSDIVREHSAARGDDEYRALDAELLAKANALPAGIMPCDLRGWSADADPDGLNVRAGPSAQAKVLGRLPPPYKFKSKSENVPEGGWLTEFSTIGFRDGWFLIEGAKPPGQNHEDEKSYPRNHPRPYPGRGWVAASKVGAAFANGDARMGGLFQAPHIDARWTPAKRDGGSEISADGGPKRIFACSGFWALVESSDGVRGWWRRLCSSQVTNCS